MRSRKCVNKKSKRKTQRGGLSLSTSLNSTYSALTKDRGIINTIKEGKVVETLNRKMSNLNKFSTMYFHGNEYHNKLLGHLTVLNTACMFIHLKIDLKIKTTTLLSNQLTQHLFDDLLKIHSNKIHTDRLQIHNTDEIFGNINRENVINFLDKVTKVQAPINANLINSDTTETIVVSTQSAVNIPKPILKPLLNLVGEPLIEAVTAIGTVSHSIPCGFALIIVLKLYEQYEAFGTIKQTLLELEILLYDILDFTFFFNNINDKLDKLKVNTSFEVNTEIETLKTYIDTLKKSNLKVLFDQKLSEIIDILQQLTGKDRYEKIIEEVKESCSTNK